MLIKNTGKVGRKLSREGVSIPLMPGASVDLPITANEAAAYRGAGFEVTGEPVKASQKVEK
jgi:hypothetical protein